jgi:amino acid adenylation domain-containing protein
LKEESPLEPQESFVEGFQASPQQSHLWRLQGERSGATTAYRCWCILRLDGELDHGQLQGALEAIVARNEILRTSLQRFTGVRLPLQVVASHAALDLQEIDLYPLEPRQRAARWAEIRSEMSSLALDLAEGAPLVVRLVRLAPGEHRLLLCLPALLADGAVFDLLLRDLGRSYAGGAEPEEPEPMQYADFAAWQSELLASDETEVGKAYWRRQRIDGARLPWENPAAGPFDPRLVVLTLEEAARTALESVAGGQGETLSDLLLACWAVLLGRLTERSSPVLGLALDGRKYEELAQVYGPLARVLPVELPIDEELALAPLVARAAEAAREAAEWQECFAWEDRAAVDGEEPFLPFAFETRREPAPMTAGGVTFAVEERFCCTDRFTAWLVCHLGAGPLRLEVHYDGSRLSEEGAGRLRDGFAALLTSLLAQPEARVGDLDSLGAGERRRLLVELNQTGVEIPSEQCVHALFEAQVKRRPEEAAVWFDGQSLTYGELNRRANQLARQLRELGVGAEKKVGLCCRRSLEMVIGIVGILKAGGVYVPLDPAYPTERLFFILEDIEADVLLTQQDVMDRIPLFDGRVLALDADWPAIARHDDADLDLGLSPDNAAYVIYTSGSTGKPKGVEVAHRSLVHSTLARLAYYREPVDSFLLASSFAFDSSVAGIFWTLCQGGMLTLPAEDFQRDLPSLVDVLERCRVSHLLCLPSLYRLILDEAEPRRLAALREVIVAGEACPAALVRRHARTLPDVKLDNEYGPTEATVWSTVHRCDPAEAEVAIGRPIANARIYLLDARLRPVPLGSPGEVFVGGAGVTRGYLSRPQLTAERFLPDPFSGEPGARLYRIGDLGRYDPQGRLFFMGRVDHQVKIRGYRIELGEIEEALRHLPGIRDVVVVAQDAPGRGAAIEPEASEPAGGGAAGKRLIAYLVWDSPEMRTSASELRGHLLSSLPEHMIPSAFAALEAFPLNANGKVDRAALPLPEELQTTPEKEFVAPRTPQERILAEIWSEILGIERVGIHDSFFELGGDSIRSVQVRAKARERGLELSVQQLFLHRTIEALAGVLTASPIAEAPATGSSPAFRLISVADRRRLPEGIENAFPLAALQLGMLFHGELDSEASLYHDILSFHVRTVLDEDALRAALRELARRHAVLRISFHLDGFSQPLQLVHPEAEIPLVVEDLAGLDAAGQEAAVHRWIGEERRRRFDWRRPPLLRFHVQRRGPGDFQLGMSNHHAILDGWSGATLLAELFELYNALSGGASPAPAAPLAASFEDFVAAEQETLAAAEGRAFWERTLAGAVSGALPRWPVHERETAGDQVQVREVTVGGPVFARLSSLASDLSVPVKSVVLASHLAVLRALYGQADVMTGLVSNGRPEVTDGEKVLGLFLNTVPLRQRLAGGSWRDLVAQTFATENELTPHRRFPLAALQEERGGAPLFDTCFNYVHFHVLEAVAGRGVEILGNLSFERTSFALNTTVTYDRARGQISLLLVGDAGRMCGAQMDLAASYYRRALEAMAEAAGARYEDESLLAEAESCRLLTEWNQTRQDYGPPRCLHELVEEQARRTPEGVALVAGGRRMSYAELDRWANRLANALRRQGVGPDVRVGICAERSAEMVVGLLGILKAGGAYVPLDPAYPAERLAFMLEDSRVRVLLAQPSWREILPEYGGETLWLDADLASIAGESEVAPAQGLQPESLAYVIYTSGSTGQPKGAMNHHRAICNRLLWMQETYGIGGEDRVLQKTPFSFDVSVWELFWPLITGARLVLAEPGGHRDPAYLARLIAEEGITTLHFVPSMLRAFLEAPEVATCVSLRRVICSGEALPHDLQERALERLGAELHNLYGPTEAAVDVTAWECRRNDPRRIVPIGRPIANLRVHLLTPDLQPVPTMSPGELHIGGVGLARGYLLRPELTAEKFIPDPFSVEPGGRLYKTGDLARYLPDGAIEFIGRIDHQVKLHGFRIELGEIEAALSGHPAIRQAVAALRRDGGEPQLVAYLLLRAGKAAPPVEELLGFLRAKLPEPELPTAFVVLDELPLSPSGKLDRRLLPEPGRARPALAVERVAPHGPAEEILLGLWSDLLRRDGLGVQDDFFALGGNSLLATQLISRVRTAFQLDVPLRSLFEARTVRSLAARLAELRNAGEGIQEPPILPVSREGVLPASFAQERLWFLDQLEPDSPFYNIPAAVRLRGDLRLDALEGALREIVRRHEILRTSFAQYEGRPVQVIAPELEPPFSLIDLGDLPERLRESELGRLAQWEARRSFDLRRGPLLRTVVVRAEARDHAVLLTMHHIVSDDWSTGVLVSELLALYGACCAGRPSPLPALAIHYADFAHWQRAWLAGEVLAAQLAYWRHQLAEAPPLLQLPADRPRPAIQSFRGAVVPLRFPAELLHGLQALGRREGATLFMTLLSAFKLVLHHLTGQRDLVVGTDVANRNRFAVEPLVGFFVNQLVLRTVLTGDPAFRELLARIREVALDGYAHQDLPFEKVVEASHPSRSLEFAPLFQVKLVLRNAPHSAAELPGLTLSALEVGKSTAQLDLILNLEETPEGLVGSAEYSTDLFDEETVAFWLQQLEAVLRVVVEEPSLSVSEICGKLAVQEREWRRMGEAESEASRQQAFGHAARRVAMIMPEGRL